MKAGMPKGWVVDASPLIVLARIGRADLIESLCEHLVIPEAVAEEVMKGAVTDPARRHLVEHGMRRVQDVSVLPLVAEWGLGPGESAVISHAYANPGVEALLDDGAARTCARMLGIPVRGTLGVLLLAKQRGLIPVVTPLFGALREAGFWIDDELLLQMRTMAGEA